MPEEESDGSKSRVRVELLKVGAAALSASAGSGGALITDGEPKIGGEGRGMRPMELLLSALASCAAMDVIHILNKQRQPLESLRIEVIGQRADEIPARFTAIHLTFRAEGAITPGKYQRAVKLGVEKYCSVGASLHPDIEITHEALLAP